MKEKLKGLEIRIKRFIYGANRKGIIKKMIQERSLLISIRYDKTIAISNQEALDRYYKHLKSGFIDEQVTLSVERIVLDNDILSIKEVCDNIFKDIKEVLINQNIEQSTLRELDQAYKKHHNYIKKLDSK